MMITIVDIGMNHETAPVEVGDASHETSGTRIRSS